MPESKRFASDAKEIVFSAATAFRSKSPRQKMAAMTLAAGVGLSPVLVYDALTDNLPQWVIASNQAGELAEQEGWHSGSALTGNYGPGPADGMYQPSESKNQEAQGHLAIGGLELLAGVALAAAGAVSVHRLRADPGHTS